MRRAMDSVFVHVVWATWDRSPLLTEAIRTVAYRTIGAKCEQLGAQMLAIGGVADHVHLLVRLPTALSVAMLVKEVKGTSGHALAQLAMARGEFFKWQGAYGAFSVSSRDLDMVVAYIKNQEEHHRQRDAIAEWELPPVGAE